MKGNPHHRTPFDDVMIIGFEDKYTAHIRFQGTKYYRRIYNSYDETLAYIRFNGEILFIKELKVEGEESFTQFARRTGAPPPR